MNTIKDITNIKFADYMEKKIATSLKNTELNQLAVRLCLENLHDQYLIYEQNNELSVGIGTLLSIQVYPQNIVLTKDNSEIKLHMVDLNTDLHEVFSAIQAENWRAYGVSNFDIAYYTYNRTLLPDENKLMAFFIPKIDIRIFNNQIYIRAVDAEDIAKIENIIDEFRPSDTIYYADCGKFEELKCQKGDQYKSMVTNAVDEITKGKYQKVILSRKISLGNRIDMPASYLSGRARNTPARSYLAKLSDIEVFGFSPETIVEVDKDKNVYTFPLAGTRALGKNAKETASLKHELLQDPKEIAEHAVSVKLAFEELENVCEEGTVSVIQFMDILERGTVQHLASRLKGQLKKGLNEWHAFSSLFPAVTASGIPKKESLEAIHRLEEDARGLYSGGIFTYDKNGALDAALVLRSAFQNEEESWIRAGAGIVKLSNAERELTETKEKLSCVSDQIIYQSN